MKFPAIVWSVPIVLLYFRPHVQLFVPGEIVGVNSDGSVFFMD